MEFLCRAAEMKFICNGHHISKQTEFNITRIHRLASPGPVFEWVCRTTYRNPHFTRTRCFLDAAALKFRDVLRK
jgi:hypothetical protein